MADKKTKECTACGGKGFFMESLLHSPSCKECNGLGVVPVKETRKSILVPPRLHRRLMYIAKDNDLKMVNFMHKIANDYEDREIISLSPDLYNALNNLATDLNIDLITFLDRVRMSFGTK